MRKLITLLLLVLFTSGISQANVADMLFSQSSGTYTEITGGNIIATGIIDDAQVANVPIGFTFNANGIDFTTMNVNPNGYIKFHPVSTTNLGSVPISSTGIATMAISAMGKDLKGLDNGEIMVLTSGTAPNRVTTIQWKNLKRYSTNYAGENLSFQIKLYETLNKAEIVYGPMIVSSYGTSEIQVGLRGESNTDFNNRTTTTDWSASTAGTTKTATMTLGSTIFPASGLTFTFTVPAPGIATIPSPANGATGIPVTTTLDWNIPASGGVPSGYRVFLGTDNPPTNIANGVDVGNVLTYDPTNDLTLATQYYWQIVPYNGTGAPTDNPVWSFTTSLGIGSIEGYITNAFGVPMGGVLVQLTNTLGSLSTTSAPNGTYAFAEVPAADYTLTASITGYNTVAYTVFVAPGVVTYQNVSMTSPSMAISPNPYSVTLNPNEYLDGAFNIANNGSGPLEWNAAIVFPENSPAHQYPDYLTVRGNLPEVNAPLSIGIAPSPAPYAMAYDAPVMRDPGDMAYCYVASAGSGTLTPGPGSFILNAPGTITRFGNAITGTNAFVMAADWANDTWYGVNYAGNAFVTIDPVTGAYTTIGTTDAFVGISYNAQDGLMYGLALDGSLKTINLATGATTSVGSAGASGFIAFEIDNDGIGYAVNMSTDQFGTINLTTGAFTSLAPLGFNANYAQDMSCDPSTNEIYYAAYDASAGGKLLLMNKVTGTSTLVGAFPGAAEIDGFAIPGSASGGWLTLGAESGTVSSYNTFALPVYFNAEGTEAGEVYTADVVFTSNPDVGTITIPVTMTVAGAAINGPDDLTAVLSNPVTGQVTLNWTFSGAKAFTNFVIKRDGVTVGTTTATTFTNILPVFGTYNYTVQAVYDEGASIPAGPAEIEWPNPTLSLDPVSLYNEQYPVSTESVTLRVANTGEGTLAYSFPSFAARQIVNAPDFTPNVRSTVKEVEVAKGENDPTDGQGNRNLRGAGGPDEFGYVWIDSDETGGPAYVWNDISTTGTLVTGLTDDNVVGPFPIGFSFPFYENAYSSVSVAANGFLLFEGTSGTLTNQNIPSATAPNNLIAWCWDDLHGQGTGSTVHYQNMGDYWIIQFTGYHEYPSTGAGTITAQVHLYSNGNIKIFYNTAANGFDRTSATVGIENGDGTVATNINYNSLYIKNNLAVSIIYPVPSFITAVTPAAGQVAAGAYTDVKVDFTAHEGYYPVGTYTEELALNTNDLSNQEVAIPATMVVYEPGMIAGMVTSAVDGSPIDGAAITAGSYSTFTDADGHYQMIMDAGTYSVLVSKTGFTSATISNVVITETQTTTVNAALEEVYYTPTLVHAVVNEADTQADVTWGTPSPDYEVIYDDGTAENYTAWALPGGMNAVKFTPAGYPATVTGGKIYVGDGSFPNNNTGFMGTTFGLAVMDDNGENGMPGTVLDSIAVTVNNYGWVEFSGLDATIEDGNFYLVMVQGAPSPNTAGVGIDQTTPTAYRSYSRNVNAGGAWGLAPYQDMMMRAFINGPAADDDRLAADQTIRTPKKQFGLISLLPATAQSGAEAEGQYLAIQNNQQNRDVTNYQIWRVELADPTQGPEYGVQTSLNASVSETNFTDTSFGSLSEGWYAYAVAANYTNGGQSPKAYSNIVGHEKLVDVTVNVSLTTATSPAGAVVTLTGHDYPFTVLSQTVPENGNLLFAAVSKGNYTIEASKVGFDEYVINTNLQSDRTFNIVLAEKKYMPRNLYVDPLTLVATWDEPLAVGVMEDFEGSVFPPEGWSKYTQNTNGWFASSDGGSSNFDIPSHTKYAVTNDDAANGDGCCDYLWTPAMDWTNLGSYRLNFASFFNGDYGHSAYVEISTDDGASWTVINTLTAASEWQDLEIDLTPYSGATGLNHVMVAFHADDNGEWASGWAIDDVQIASGGVPFNGYGVFLDGTLIGNSPETTYTYTDLNYGQTYLAGVAALFSSGYSELDTYEFQSLYLIPPTNLEGSSPALTDYVHLTWLAPTVTPVAANQEPLPVIVAQPAADVATTINAHSFPQTSVPLGSSRDLLYDNGTIINSPGTGVGGADESILQGDLGMTTYGPGFQQSAGNSVADDFEVTGNWDIESFEFFGYQTGSTTTSTFTGAFYRIYDGNPMEGGTVIYGDLTTNRMISTEFANIYRNNDGPNGSTNRPVMRIVAEAPDLTLPAGTYWIEWCTTGSASSGPWVPPITIQGETTTGNALQNQSGSWIAITDVGPQGMPFLINGSGGGASVANLLGYNVYRDNTLVGYVEKPALEYYDLGLEPDTYSYHITAVYDLTPYGFAGQTGESVMEGPIDVDVVYGFDLPFVENFDNGFDVNNWTADGDNWVIDGQAGNPAPSAKFTYSPVQTDYSLSLNSSWINGIGTDGYIDGKFYLDFDLKLDDNTATGEEQMKVEVYNGLAWATVATYTAEGDMDWEAKHLDITSIAKNKVFRIRFTATGVNSLAINNWLVDNVHIYRVCDAPTNLTATINSQFGDRVELAWEAPAGPVVINAWLAWDNGTNADALGLNGGTFDVAARFTPDQLTEYAGTNLTKIRAFLNSAGGTVVLKVWTGANASNLVLSQPVASYTAATWNEFVLNTPVPVTGTTELWFGYTCTDASGVFVAGMDAGPAVTGYGDMINYTGSWENTTALGFPANWNLEGYVETPAKSAAINLQPIVDNTIYNAHATLAKTGMNNVNQPNATVAKSIANDRPVIGYNVFRDGAFLANTPETTYLDNDPAISVLGKVVCYKVTAVYDDCESDFSNEDCATITSNGDLSTDVLSIYPNPSNNVVNIELTNNISQFVVYNYLGQVVTEQVVTKDQTVRLDVSNYDAGAYMVKFITRTGESISRKIVVTK